MNERAREWDVTKGRTNPMTATSADLLLALKAIAEMKVDETTDHAQLSALCIAIAQLALAKSAAASS